MLGGKETREEEVGGRLESRGEGEKRNWLSISSFGAEGGKERERRIRLSPCDRRRRRSQIEKTFLIPLSKGKKGKSRGGVKKNRITFPLSLSLPSCQREKKRIFFIPSCLSLFPYLTKEPLVKSLLFCLFFPPPPSSHQCCISSSSSALHTRVK